MENLTRMDTFYTLQGTAAEIQTKSVSEKCQSRPAGKGGGGWHCTFFSMYQTIKKKTHFEKKRWYTRVKSFNKETWACSFLNCILCIAFLTKQDSHIDCSVEMLILVVEKIMQILRVYFLSVERFPIGTDWVDQEPGLLWLKRTLLRLMESSMSSRSYWPTRPTSRAIIRYDPHITFSVCILQFKTFFVINIFFR